MISCGDNGEGIDVEQGSQDLIEAAHSSWSELRLLNFPLRAGLPVIGTRNRA
jgi:hypothetical protein